MADGVNRNVNKSLEMLQKQISDLHTSTYYTRDNSEEMKNQVSDKLDDAIRKSTQNDEEFQNISNTSKLFMKLMRSGGNSASVKLTKSFGSGTIDDISTMFQNPDIVASIMDTYSKTKWITELDNEFDLICKYMPKLQAALDIKRDAVLCSDTYTKKFLNIRAKGENPSSDKNANIQNNIESMMKTYELAEKAEQWYDDTSKYGEEFVYCVPYSVAFEELLKRKKDTSYSLQEMSYKPDLKDYINPGTSGSASVTTSENGDISINIRLDTSKVLMEAVKNNYTIRKSIENNKFRSLTERFDIINESGESFENHLSKDGKNTVVKFDSTVDNEITWEDDDKTAASGLIDINGDNKKKINVNGAVIKTIKHDKIIPIYIEDTLFGGYYIRYRELTDIGLNATGNIKGYNSVSGMFNNGPIGTNITSDEDTANQNDLLLRRIAGEISQKVDKAFINANADLKKEIYLMLKFNDKYNQISHTIDMDIVFIPADDIHHLKFREDPETHRGVSDLWDALVPAKQWITLNLTSILGWTTRGFDRRVYYVKQSLDTNTAQSLLNVINTIKKGNFGIRQMESVNNILNIVGRFNDFVIPIGPSGDPPIQFDTQPGQQFDFPDQLLNTLEESAVNSTDVPLEIVNSSTGMDFAVRYTMTNAKLLRAVLKRQLKIEDFLSKIFTKIYRFEFNENVELEVTLPPPAFLSMTQGTQLLSSAVQYADSITEIEMAGESDEAKQMFKKRLIRKLIPSYLTDEEIKEIKDNITIDASISGASAEDDY